MTTYSHTHETMSPFVDGAVGIARDLAWNILLDQFEESFTITDYDAEVVGRIQASLETSIRKGCQVGLRDDDEVDYLDLLVAFKAIAGTSVYEMAAVGISKQGEQEPITLVSATKGAPTRVSLPEVGLREIRNRLDREVATKAVVVHNHPQGILHNLLGASVLGPSAQDRRVVTSAYQTWFQTDGLLHVDFYLVEAGEFRKFVVPSAAEVWLLAKRLGIVSP